MLAVLEGLGEARANRDEVGDLRCGRRVVVGAEMSIEQRLGRGERVMLSFRMGVRRDHGRAGPAEGERAIRGLNYVEKVKVS